MAVLLLLLLLLLLLPLALVGSERLDGSERPAAPPPLDACPHPLPATAPRPLPLPLPLPLPPLVVLRPPFAMVLLVLSEAVNGECLCLCLRSVERLIEKVNLMNSIDSN
jgi:hypothetical protein